MKVDGIPASKFDRHGQIRCGTLSVRNLDASLALYCDYLDQEILEEAVISAELAAAWDLPAMANAPFALLRPKSGALSYLRLIQVAESLASKPATTLGWNAFEISVRDVFSLADAIKDSDFKIVGPPKLVDGFTSFIPMQVVGPDGEVLFLNQVNHSDDDTDLPIAQCSVDQIFIVVVASADREASATEYTETLGLDKAATHELRYSLINRAFDLPAETKHRITMIQNGRMPFAQIDQYPQTAKTRLHRIGTLPGGNSMVSVMVENIDSLPIANMAVGKAIRPEGALYQGRKTQVVQGSASELIELIEI